MARQRNGSPPFAIAMNDACCYGSPPSAIAVSDACCDRCYSGAARDVHSEELDAFRRDHRAWREHVERFEYRNVGVHPCAADKERNCVNLAGVAETSRQLMQLGAPIKCLDAVAMAIVLSHATPLLVRFPLRFCSRSDNSGSNSNSSSSSGSQRAEVPVSSSPRQTGGDRDRGSSTSSGSAPSFHWHIVLGLKYHGALCLHAFESKRKRRRKQVYE